MSASRGRSSGDREPPGRRPAPSARERSPSTKRPDEAAPSPLATDGRSALLDLQRSAGNHAANEALARANPAEEIRRQARQGGDALPADLRGTSERALGHELADVRVHDDPAARALADTLGARAFTVGRDVWLGPGESVRDRRLISHELTHVAQQAAGPVTGRRVAPDLTVSDPADGFEQAASRAGESRAPAPGRQARETSRATSRRASHAGQAGGTLTVQREAATAPSPKALPAKRRELTPDEDAELKADVDLIVRHLKSKWLSKSEQTEIVSVIDKWFGRDRQLSGGITPYLDEILLRLKMRAYSRSPASTPWTDVWAIAYDDLWYRMDGLMLDQFKDLVSRSKGQRTSGPGTAEGENFWKTLSKQEAIGMWGMLKGMGTGAGALADDAKWLIVKDMQLRGIPVKDPGSAADWLAKQFDESGKIVFDKDYTDGEVLFLGLTAKDIGTGGGAFIWQLVMMGKGGGGTLMKALQFAGALRGVDEAAQEIADIIAGMQKRDGKLDAAKLAEDPRFWKAVTKLAASIFAAMSAGVSPNSSAAVKAAQSRIALLLDAAQLAPLAGELVQVWLSDDSFENKKAKAGPILLETLSKLITLALSTKAHVEEHGTKGKGAPEGGKGASQEEKGAGTDVEPLADKSQTEQKAAPKPKPKPKTPPAPVVAPDTDASSGALAQVKSETPAKTGTSATPVTQDAAAQTGKAVAETTKVVAGESAAAPVVGTHPDYGMVDDAQLKAETNDPAAGSHPEYGVVDDAKVKAETTEPGYGDKSGETTGTTTRSGTEFHEYTPAEVVTGLRVERDMGSGQVNKVSYVYTAEAANVKGKQQTKRSFSREQSDPSAQPTSAEFSQYNQANPNAKMEVGHAAQRAAGKVDPKVDEALGIYDPSKPESDTNRPTGKEVERGLDKFNAVMPMAEALNRGAGSAWSAAERRTQDLAKQHGWVEVTIVPTYGKPPARMPDGTPIPESFVRTVTKGMTGEVLDRIDVKNQ